MWIMSRHGFYSIVAKTTEEIQVRARERQDLRNLIDRVPLPDQRIVDTPDGDYGFRLIIDRQTLADIIGFLADSVDYPNFKGRIAQTPDQRRKPYHEVWEVLAEALGAFGQPGQRSTPGADESG